MKKYVPSFITCLNLLCGCVAVVFSFQGDLVMAAYLVFTAAFLDLLDGLFARLLNAYSEFGKQLDSLADMVSFGLVPGVVMHKMLADAVSNMQMSEAVKEAIVYIPFVITVFSALRLAKFNIDTRQSDSFIGLATPANTLLTVSWPLIVANQLEPFTSFIQNLVVLLSLSFIQSYLLVAEIPMFSFKMKSMAWSGNELRYVFMAVSTLLFGIFFYGAIPLIVFFYVLLSVLTFKKKTA
jgi:CDP-diacylglycerol--serine O-phosphatidyltransferase